MDIGSEIKQTKFKSEFHKALLNIIYTGNWFNSIISKLLKDYDLTHQQYNILRILRGQQPNAASILILQERMLDRMSNASRLVEKLRIKGYVERKENCDDRRQVDVSITQSGLDLLKELDPIIDGSQNNIYNLTDQEAQSLNALLDKLRG